ERSNAPGMPVAAVLPFDVRGDSSRAFLGEALSALLSTRLDAPGVLRTLESNAVVRAIGARGRMTSDDADARVSALGADVLVHGTVVVLGDSLEIDAELRPRDGANGRVLRATVSGSADSIFVLADRLGSALLVAREARPLGNSLLSGTTSMPALKAFLSGERALRAWHLTDAVAAYHDAVRIDSGYAMAWYRLAFVQVLAREGDLGNVAHAMSLKLASQLPPRQALLQTAIAAWHQHDYAAAEPALLSLVQRYPDDADPWSELGDYRMHVGPEFGQPTSLAEVPLARALALDSAGHPEVRLHLAQLAMERGDTARSRALVSPLLASSGVNDQSVEHLRMMLTLSGGPPSEVAPLVHMLRDEPSSGVARALLISSFSSGVTSIARAVADSLAAAASSPQHQRVGLAIAQQMAVAGRRWSDVVRFGAALSALDSLAGAESWANIANAFDVRVPSEAWQRAGDVLERAALRDTSPARWSRLVSAATLAARAGDEPAYARRMTVLTQRTHAPRGHESALRIVRALHADLRGDSLTADREVASMDASIDSPLGRWLRARSLERAGRGEVAERWYLSTPWGPYGLLLTRSALEHAAALSAARGDRVRQGVLTRRADRFGGGALVVE
ncbi:MAG: hypothetical protein ABI625_25660, partial [bacterium]